MNFKLLVFFLLSFLIYSNSVVGQQYSFNYTLRYESFAMNDLRTLQETAVSEWPVNSKNIVDMPARLTHAGSFTYYSENPFSIGLSAGFGSTGSRYYYEDYSGYLSNDFITSRVDISGQLSLFHPLKTSQLVIRVEPGANFSTLKIKSEALINNEFSEDQIDFKSLSFSLRPGIGLRKNIDKFFIEGMIMYELNIPSKLLLSSNSDYYLQSSNGYAIDTDWSGIKLNLSVGIMVF